MNSMNLRLSQSIVYMVGLCVWHENTISNQINNDEQWQRKTAINLYGMNKLENIHSKCTPIWLFMFVLASIQMNQFNRMIDMYMNMNNIITVPTIFRQFFDNFHFFWKNWVVPEKTWAMFGCLFFSFIFNIWKTRNLCPHTSAAVHPHDISILSISNNTFIILSCKQKKNQMTNKIPKYFTIKGDSQENYVVLLA